MLADRLQLNKPTESAVGHVLNIISITMTILAIVTFCLDSLPVLHRDVTFLLPVIKIQVRATVIPFYNACKPCGAFLCISADVHVPRGSTWDIDFEHELTVWTAWNDIFITWDILLDVNFRSWFRRGWLRIACWWLKCFPISTLSPSLWRERGRTRTAKLISDRCRA